VSGAGFAVLVCARLLAADAMSDGDRLLFDGADDVATYRAALARYDEVPATSAHVFERRAEAWFRLGELATETSERLDDYQHGKEAAEKAIALDASCSRCQFWRGANMGRYGQVDGILKSLFALDDVKKTFRRAVEIDRNNVDARLALANIDAKVPSIAGGDVDRAIRAMRTLVADSPHFTRAKLDLAELLHDRGKSDEALALAQSVLVESAPQNRSEHRKLDVPRARRHVREWTAPAGH
jgi:tetratricopeptide (TPR) repeat protein